LSCGTARVGGGERVELAVSRERKSGMSSKRQTTMAKLTRERKVKEKRELKLEKKAAAKAARAEALEGGSSSEEYVAEQAPEAD
jgi:hypothetical protein